MAKLFTIILDILISIFTFSLILVWISFVVWLVFHI